VRSAASTDRSPGPRQAPPRTPAVALAGVPCGAARFAWDCLDALRLDVAPLVDPLAVGVLRTPAESSRDGTTFQVTRRRRLADTQAVTVTSRAVCNSRTINQNTSRLGVGASKRNVALRIHSSSARRLAPSTCRDGIA